MGNRRTKAGLQTDQEWTTNGLQVGNGCTKVELGSYHRRAVSGLLGNGWRTSGLRMDYRWATGRPLVGYGQTIGGLLID